MQTEQYLTVKVCRRLMKICAEPEVNIRAIFFVKTQRAVLDSVI